MMNRTIGLDFKGGLHRYCNTDVGVDIAAHIAPSGISFDRCNRLAVKLNRESAGHGVRFAVGSHADATIHIGKTDAFNRFGRFAGLAEGIGSGDAFVLLDDSSSDDELLTVIRHEAGHLLGTLDHGGMGLERYASVINYTYNVDKPKSNSSHYDYYLYAVRTINQRINDQFYPVGVYDGIIELEFYHDYRIVQYLWDRYDIDDGHGATQYVTEDSVYNNYRYASDCEAYRINIYGGYAMNCTAYSIFISHQHEADTYVWQSSIYDTNNDEYAQSNYVFTNGGAVGCKSEYLILYGGAMAFECTVSRSMSVEAVEFEANGEILWSRSEDCILVSNDEDHGCRLDVGYGGTALNTLIKRNLNTFIYTDWVYIGNYDFDEEKFNKLGYAEAIDLTVENGEVYVYKGGKLHNATINGELHAVEGAVLEGDIVCASVDLEGVTPNDNITIKVDLRDYAQPFFEEWVDNTYIEYYANYKTITRVYDPESIHYFEWEEEYYPYYTDLLYVTNGYFDNKDGRFDMKDVKHSFSVDLGKVDAKSLSKIVIDFDGTDAYFDDGYFYFEYPHALVEVDDKEYIPFTEYDLPFQFKGDKRNYSVEYSWGGDIAFVYDGSLVGRTEEVLWLSHGEDAKYDITLAPLMLEAVGGEAEIQTDEGSITVAPLHNSTLTVAGDALGGVNMVVSAENEQHRDLTCDLELLVVPEELPIVGKIGAKEYANMLRKAQKGRLSKVSAQFPHNLHAIVLDMPIDLTNVGATLSADWTTHEAEMKLQGKLEWKWNKETAGTGKNVKLVIDLSGDNYFSITTKNNKYDWKLVGEMKLPDFKQGKFGFSNMVFRVDTVKQSFFASTYVQLPGFNYSFGGDITIVKGSIESIHIGVDGLNVMLWSTGLYLQAMAGGFSGLTNPRQKFGFDGKLGLTFGRKMSMPAIEWLGIDGGEFSLAEINLETTINIAGEYTGKATISQQCDLIKGEGELHISKGDFSIKGDISLLAGCFSGGLSIKASNGNFTVSGNGTMALPREKVLGLLAGLGGSVNIRANFNDESNAKSYVMAWRNAELFGNKFTVGIKCSFDGTVKRLSHTDLLGGDDFNPPDDQNGKTRNGDASTSATYIVETSGLTLFQINFTVDGAYASLTYGLNEYFQADIAAGIYDDIQIVDELSGESDDGTILTIAVNNAGLGEWIVSAYGDENATFGAYAYGGSTPEPIITSITVGEDARSATIYYTLGDLSALENAVVSVFRNDGDAMGYEGMLIGSFSAAEANGVFDYDLGESAGGAYAFYMMVESDNLTPAYSEISGLYNFRIVDDEAPDQIQLVNAVWRSSGTELTWDVPYDDNGVAGYKIRFYAGDEDWFFVDDEDLVERNVKTPSFIFDDVPNGTYSYQVAAYDAEGNLGAWSVQESAIVLTNANAIYKNTTITEDLELATYESAYNIVATEAKLTTAENSLVSASTIGGDAEISGILENSIVNGMATLLEGGNAIDITVNGDFTVYGTADGITVAEGGRLTIENGGVGMNVTVEAGGALFLMDGAEYDNVTVDYDATLTIPDSGVIRLEGDIFTASPISTYCTINGNGNAIHFEQYKQTDEFTRKNGAFYDDTALVTNLDKFLGNALDIIIDTASYGEFKIADAADYVTSGISVTDHATGNSVLLDLDMPNALGGTFCTLHKDADGLWLNVHNPNEWDHKNITIGTGGDYPGTFKLEGQWAQNVKVVNNGRFTCDDGAVVDGLVIDGGGSNNATATVENAIVTNAVLNNGTFYLNDGGHVTNIMVNGGNLVLGDGTLDDAFIGTNGRMEIAQTSNPILTGTITVQGGVYLSNSHAPIETNAHFVFDLEGRNVNNDNYFISEGTVFTGNTTYSLLLPEHPETGYYCITNISTDSPVFETFSITVTTANGNVLGDLTINGDAICSNGFEYSLYNQDATIYFNVNESSEPYEITTQEWDGADGTYIVEYSRDDFQTAVRVSVDSTAVDSFAMPSGDYQWRVRPQDSGEWTAEGTLAVKDEKDNDPKHIASNDNAITDVFFTKPRGTWNGGFKAFHNGSMDGWQGTNESVSLRDKNKLADIIEGSNDANVLLMTDDANGDALFVDDIYSALPGDILEQQSRLAKIDEIRAGAGDDIVDLTSQEFMYVGGGMTVRGGLGDDVIWANNGDNWLFGDTGNDRLVGAAGNDVISGGAGNDSLHGGGGNDIFAFGGDWGKDTVEQLANGKVTLWFDNGDESKWDATTLTYQDGDKSVHVSGVAAEAVTLKFGDDGSGKFTDLLSAGAFAEFTSEKIFEDRNRGMLA